MSQVEQLHDFLPTGRHNEPLPHNVEAEQALLGAIFINNDAFYAASVKGLRSEHFFDPLHKRIYAVMTEMISAGIVCSPINAKTRLDGELQVGDMTLPQYLARLASEATTIINAPDFARTIVTLHAFRQLALIGDDLAAAGRKADETSSVSGVVASFQDSLVDLIESTSSVGANLKAGVDEFLSELSDAYQRRSISGIPWPLDEIDQVMTGPMERGNLYGLLSSSGEGKTSMMLQIVRNAVDHGHPAILFTYDQKESQVVRQMAGQELGINVRHMREAKITEQQFSTIWETSNKITALPFRVVPLHRNIHGVGHIAAHARAFCRFHAKEPEKWPLIVVDHIRAVKPVDAKVHEGEKAAHATGGLKALAGSLGATVLVLIQRNSKGADRPNPRPVAEDLFGGDQARESYDGIFYIYNGRKWRRKLLSTAATEHQENRINNLFQKDFKDTLHDGGAEIGSIKNRYGDEAVRLLVRFQEEYTRYISVKPDDGQGTLLDGF